MKLSHQNFKKFPVKISLYNNEKIKEAGYDVTTPVIVSNTDQYAIVEKTATGEVTKESNLIKVQ